MAQDVFHKDLNGRVSKKEDDSTHINYLSKQVRDQLQQKRTDAAQELLLVMISNRDLMAEILKMSTLRPKPAFHCEGESHTN